MTSRTRNDYIDAAKGIGIALVFYGHLIQQHYGASGSALLLPQYQCIYSFHVPFFFFVAGFFWTKRTTSVVGEFRRLFLRRLLPYYSFGLMFLPLHLLYNWARTGNFGIDALMPRFLAYAHGGFGLDDPTWFLVCLFTTELLAFLVLSSTTARFFIMACGIVSLFLGLSLSNHRGGLSVYWELRTIPGTFTKPVLHWASSS